MVTAPSHTEGGGRGLLAGFVDQFDNCVSVLLLKARKQRTTGALDFNGMLSEGGWIYICHCCLSSDHTNYAMNGFLFFERIGLAKISLLATYGDSMRILLKQSCVD